MCRYVQFLNFTANKNSNLNTDIINNMRQKDDFLTIPENV